MGRLGIPEPPFLFPTCIPFPKSSPSLSCPTYLQVKDPQLCAPHFRGAASRTPARSRRTELPLLCAPAAPEPSLGAAASPLCRWCRRCRCRCPNRGQRLVTVVEQTQGDTERTSERISPSLPWGACCACQLLSNEFWVQDLTLRTAGTGDRASFSSRSCGCRSSLDAPTRALGEGTQPG